MSRLPSTRFILQGQDAAPQFDIAISGKDASNASQLFEAVRPLVVGVSYEEDEEMATMFELTIANQPEDVFGSKSNYQAVVDSKAFQEGNFIDLWMGYGGERAYMGRVEIVKWLPRFPSVGETTFTIKGYDGRHKMMKSNEAKKKAGKKPRRTFYKGQPDEAIVRKVAEKYGYGIDADRTEVKKRTKTVPLPTTDTTSASKIISRSVFPTRIQPADMDDWAFLQKLAKINRFDLWCDYDLTKSKYIVHFKKRLDAGQAEYLFQYREGDGGLLEAEPDFAIQEQPTDVEVLFYDKKLRQVQRTVITDANPHEDVNLKSASQGKLTAQKEIGPGARVRFSAFGQVIELVADRPFRSKKEAETHIKNWLKERERDFLLLRGRLVGVETLRPRQIHEFGGMGKRLNGLYRLTQTKHSQVPGSPYVVEFVGNKVLSQEVSRRKKTTKTKTAAASAADKYAAKIRAAVPDIRLPGLGG